MPSGNFEILHALKRVLEVSEAPFRAHAYSTYIPASCHLYAFSGFRSKSTTYRALASGCAVVT